MRRLLLAATVLLAGCGATASAVVTSGGPLGRPDPGGGACYRFHPGEVITSGFVPLHNDSRYPVTITGVRVTGLRHMTVEAVYAYALNPGGPGPGAIGSAYGWPARSLRHPAIGATVRAHGYEQIVTVLTADGTTAYASGEDVSYTSHGQSYVHVTPWFLGEARVCKSQSTASG